MGLMVESNGWMAEQNNIDKQFANTKIRDT